MKNFFTQRDENYIKPNEFVIKSLSIIMIIGCIAGVVLLPDKVDKGPYLVLFSLGTAAGLLGMAVLYLFFRDYFFVRYIAGLLCMPELSYLYYTTQYTELLVLVVSSNIPVIIYNDKKCTLSMVAVLYLGTLNFHITSSRVYDVTDFVKLTVLAGITAYTFLWAQINLYQTRQQKNQNTNLRIEKYHNKQEIFKIADHLSHVKEDLYVLVDISRHFKAESQTLNKNAGNLNEVLKEIYENAVLQKNLLSKISNYNESVKEKSDVLDKSLKFCTAELLNEKDSLNALAKISEKTSENINILNDKLISLNNSAKKIKRLKSGLDEISELLFCTDVPESGEEKEAYDKINLLINELSKAMETYLKQIAYICGNLNSEMDKINAVLNSNESREKISKTAENISSASDTLKSASENVSKADLYYETVIDKNNKIKDNVTKISYALNNLAVNTEQILKSVNFNTEKSSDMTKEVVLIIDQTEKLSADVSAI